MTGFNPITDLDRLQGLIDSGDTPRATAEFFDQAIDAMIEHDPGQAPENLRALGFERLADRIERLS